MKNATRNSEDLNLRVSPKDCQSVDEVLMQALIDTDYRFGTLHFSEPRTEDSGGSSSAAMIATWVHEIEMVLHPRRGALLLRGVYRNPMEPRDLLRARIGEAHAQLADLQRKIRSRLDADPRWRGRPVVLGIGVIVMGDFRRDDLPFGVPRQLIVETPQLESLEDRLEELFEYYTTPAVEPVEVYGEDLIDVLTNCPDMGRFFDEASTVELYNRIYEDFGHPAQVA